MPGGRGKDPIVPASLRIDGLTELAHDLTRLPETLGEAAAPRVATAADDAEATIRANYPVRSGELRKGLQQRIRSDGAAHPRVVLVNDAPHALVYEYGSELRHTATGASRGRMPAAHNFVPVVVREKRDMVEDVVDLVEREGLTVRGG